MSEFLDRTALVSGAGGAIGCAVASRLARERAGLLLVDLDEPALQRTASRLEEETVPVIGLVADLATEEGLQKLLQAVTGFRTGFPSMVVHHATVELRAPFLSVGRGDCRRQFEGSVESAFYLFQLMASQWVASSTTGVIVDVCSVAGNVFFAGASVYATAMAGLRGMTGALALELAPFGIRVNAVAPGLLEGEENVFSSDLVPAGRPGSAEEVANVVSFLVSDRSSYVTGQTLAVDGGYSLT